MEDTTPKKKKSGPSGPSKSYTARKEGAVSIQVWIAPEAAARLDRMCAKFNQPKRQVIERLLFGTLRVAPKTAEELRAEQPNHHVPDDPVVAVPDPAAMKAAVKTKARLEGTKREAVALGRPPGRA